MLGFIKVLLIEPISVVLGPLLLAWFLGPLWPWLYLATAAWLTWVAFISAQNAFYVWRAIFRREPWRDAFYRSLLYQGSSRARAHQRSTFAPVREPLRFAMAALVVVGVSTWYFQPESRSEPLKAFDPASSHHRH